MNLYFLSLNKNLAYNIALEYSKQKSRTFVNIQKMIELKFKKSFDFDDFSDIEFKSALSYEVGLHQFYKEKNDEKRVLLSNHHTSYIIMSELNKNGLIVYFKNSLENIMQHIIDINNVEESDIETVERIAISLTKMHKIYLQNSDIIIDIEGLNEQEILNNIPYLSV